MADIRYAIEAQGEPLLRRSQGSIPQATILWLAALANGIVIVVLWWRGGNVTGVHSAGQLLNSIGRLTGLLSAYLALIQVLLLARLPWLERLVGFDRLTVWHRRNGKLVLYLVLAHVVFTTIGYALIDRLSIIAEANILLTNYPGMIAATIGTVLFIVVVVTSLVIARRRLRYETWYAVHFTIYAGIALAWFHQIPTGNEFITNKPAADYWLSLYVATLALLVVFRVLHPAAQTVRHRLRVERVTEEVPGVVSLHISGRHLDKLHARAGQFFIWRFLTWSRFWEAHPFSLSAAPDGRTLRLTVKSSGDFTRRIGEIKPGTRVIAEGPFGVFTDAARHLERVVLIAGGIGITPIRSLLEEMTGDLVLIYRVVREQDIVFREELGRLAQERGIRLCYVVGDHTAPGAERLLSPEHLRQLVPDIAGREIYLCGPPAMMNVLERNVRQANVPSRYIHTERFAL